MGILEKELTLNQDVATSSVFMELGIAILGAVASGCVVLGDSKCPALKRNQYK